MRKILLSGLFLFPAMATLCQGSVLLTINNLRNDKGVCRACLFDNEGSYNGKVSKPSQCSSAAIDNGVARLQFEGISAGTYAIFVYHDANNNNQLDRNFMGIPTEGYGASRNKLPFAGAPTFRANMFTVANKTRITLPVTIRNLF
jgi:uncharacterized protein (DUF2141 family)